MIVPLVKLFYNKILHSNSDLKYVIYNLHDMNIAPILYFLGYWDRYGYSKYIKFASSLRFELLKDGDDFFIRVIFDDFVIHPVFCENSDCTFDEFRNYVKEKLITSDDKI